MSLLTNVLKLWRTGQYLLPADSGFSPKHLLAGRVGWWLDPLDFRYARQDSAGATAYTAVEQGVGMAVDKSANGLTFVQASAPAKPVVSARVNLLRVQSEEITSGGSSLAFIAGSVVDRYGVAVRKAVPNTNNTVHLYPITVYKPAGKYRIRFEAKAGEYSFITYQGRSNEGLWKMAAFNLDTGLVQNNSGAVSAVMSPLGYGWYLCEAVFENTTNTTGLENDGIFIGSNATNWQGFAGDGSSGLHFTRCEIVTEKRWHLPYQRVNTPTYYDTAGFPHCLKFDGAATNLVGASGGGASTAFYFGAAVQFGKVGAVQTIVSDAGTNTGFKIRTTAANQIEISAGNGAAFTAVNTTETFAAGDVAFIELFDNGTNLSACLGNGTPATVARPAVSSGTAQMTLGKANNAASEYSGVSIFSAVYLKDYCPTAAERADYKRWALQRAGVAS